MPAINRDMNLAIEITAKTDDNAATQTTTKATIENASTGLMDTQSSFVGLVAFSPTVEYPGFGSHFIEKSLAPPSPNLWERLSTMVA